jgi:2-methylcitrate dehydratase PrpD
MSAPVTDALVAFACGPIAPPPHTLEFARGIVAVTLARGLSASHDQATEIALDSVLPLGTPAQASLFGRSERLAAQWAAFVNGVGAHAALVPAVLAIGEREHASGHAVLEAIVVGTEANVRISESVAPDHADRGWDPAGTIAPLGTALACGRILKLDPVQMRYALGVAATQAAGLWCAFGTMTHAFHFGRAAADAIEAALLAQAGFTGPAAPIEGRRGFAALLARRFHPELVTRGLGVHYVTERAASDGAHRLQSHVAELVEGLDSLADVTLLAEAVRAE